MKKIVYFVNYIQDEPNSVANILSVMLEELAADREYEQIVASVFGNPKNTYVADSVGGFKTYTSKKYTGFASLAVRAKRKLLGVPNEHACSTAQIRAILDAEQPDFVVFFLCSPEESWTRLCQEKHIPFLYMLYDTYLGRPGIDPVEAKRIESAVIDQSAAYFVPGFFYDEYRQYQSDKVLPYDLPLLIGKEEVKAAFGRSAKEYGFSYFGQVQRFRNADLIKDICRKLHIKIDVFPSSPVKQDDVFRVHKPVSGTALYDAAAHSRFLIAFDNSVPYDHYLPSKAYLYVSFTKPVIAFGDNKKSALRDFFRDYPFFYYQDIHDSCDGLAAFIEKHKDLSFNEGLYARYERYSVENALSGIKHQVKTILGPET